MDKTKLTELELLEMAMNMATAGQNEELVAYFQKKKTQLENKRLKDKERKSKHKGEISEENKELAQKFCEILKDSTSEETALSALEVSHLLNVSGPKVTHLHSIAPQPVVKVKIKNKVHYYLPQE